jgi:dGTPase
MESCYHGMISAARLRHSSQSGRSLELEILSDKTRIVSSSAFRRLQTKAQVFSLEQNASVRTRLTHTLEVAMYGELIAETAFSKLLAAGKVDLSYRLPFVQTVENACLLHDLGNPPFGHLGEYAIRAWFIENRDAICNAWQNRGMENSDIRAHFNAFAGFDGNPQGLRIVTHLQWLTDEFGMNLTCSLIASTLKYLRPQVATDTPFGKKVGYFETERDSIFDVWTTLGLRTDGGELKQRHPLTFLMEAADDIAYCLSDIEDAIEKEIVTADEFFDEVGAELTVYVREAPTGAGSQLGPNERFILFRIALTRYLVDCAATLYAASEDAILNGEFGTPLLDGDELASLALSRLKAFSKNRIFVSREAVEIELSGYRIIQDILKRYEPLIQLSKDDFGLLAAERSADRRPGEYALESRLFTLLPRKHRKTYEHFAALHPKVEPALRTHLIVDYLAGMTDSHAVKIFSMLNGTSGLTFT